jgi:hypothetical protein
VQVADPWTALCLRLSMSCCIIAHAILDCLDGQHARRTKQTSKLGELLDHCTDAIGIPLTTAACCWALHADNVRTQRSCTGLPPSVVRRLCPAVCRRAPMCLTCALLGVPVCQLSFVVSMVLAIMTYNHQLLLYHLTGDFVLCDTDGPKGSTRPTHDPSYPH